MPKKPITRIAFSLSQFVTVGTLFYTCALHMMSDQQTEDTHYTTDELWESAVASIPPALLFFMTSYIFQGARISDEAEDEDEIDPTYKAPPRSWKSNTAELLYLTLMFGTLYVNTRFCISSVKGFYKGLEGSNITLPDLSFYEEVYAGVLAAVFFSYSLLTDSYENCEMLYQKYTDAKTPDNALVHTLARPLANCFGRSYIRTIGTLTHVGEHSSSILTAVPAQVWLSLYNNPDPTGFIALCVGYGMLASYFIAFCAIQTYKFETHEAIRNLYELEFGKEAADKMLANENLVVPSCLYGFVKLGMRMQALFIGLDDGATPFLLVRQLMKHMNLTEQMTVALPVGLATALCSGIGVYQSEIKEALTRVKKKNKRSHMIQTGNGEDSRLLDDQTRKALENPLSAAFTP